MKKCENSKCENLLTALQEKDGRKFCCRSCSNSVVIRREAKPLPIFTCEWCKSDFQGRRHTPQRFCGRSCSSQYTNATYQPGTKGGKASATSQQRRSKNEIYFFELCEKKFQHVLNNQPIFEGWDADVIIKDLKYAVLWNGVWHYKQISKSQSLVQVQTRDKLKIDAITRCGFIPYVVKDMGSYDPMFVESEFEKFCAFCGVV